MILSRNSRYFGLEYRQFYHELAKAFFLLFKHRILIESRIFDILIVSVEFWATPLL